MRELVFENGIAYTIENGKVVEAAVVEEFTTDPEPEDLHLGNRVSWKTKPGTVVAKVANIYGDAIGVRFDDGTTEELDGSVLTKISDAEPPLENPIDDLRKDWQDYNALSEDTLEQVEAKTSVARTLNLRAKALKTNKNVAFNERISLDKIATSTDVDLFDLKRTKDLLLDFDAETDYIRSLPRYEMTDRVSSRNDDASWVDFLAEDTEDEADEFDWAAHLAATAYDIVNELDVEQLKDSDAVRSAIDFQSEYNQLDDAKRAYLIEAVRQASVEKINQPLEKTASAQDFDLEGYDPSELYF